MVKILYEILDSIAQFFAQLGHLIDVFIFGRFEKKIRRKGLKRAKINIFIAAKVNSKISESTIIFIFRLQIICKEKINFFLHRLLKIKSKVIEKIN